MKREEANEEEAQVGESGGEGGGYHWVGGDWVEYMFF